MRTALLGIALLGATGVAAAVPLRVAEVIARAPVAGRLTITGYVARVYLCPSCPEGAVCKPCVGDHLVLSDERHALGPGEALGPADVQIAGERAALRRLRAGGRYDVDVQVRPPRAAGRAISDLELVGARPRR